VARARGDGSATLEVTSITGTVARALLFWHGPTNIASTDANARIRMGDQFVIGTNLGVADDNCWSGLFSNSQAYRADVTDIVRGNGTYRVFDLAGPGVDINGLSLIVLYDDGDASNDVNVFLYEGNDSNIESSFEPGDWRQEWPGVAASRSSTVTVELHVSDGQSFNDGAMQLNDQPFGPQGGIFEGDSVPNGLSTSSTSGGLWDIIQYPGIGRYLPDTGTATTSLTLTHTYENDCLSLVVGAVIVRR